MALNRAVLVSRHVSSHVLTENSEMGHVTIQEERSSKSRRTAGKAEKELGGRREAPKREVLGCN